MYSVLIGRLGKDAKVNKTAKGTSVVNFSVAEDIGWSDDKKTHWVSCSFWGERAVKVSEYLKKGTQVAVQGESYLEEYEDQDGNSRSQTKFQVSDLKLLGSADGGAKGGGKPSLKPADEISFADDDIPF